MNANTSYDTDAIAAREVPLSNGYTLAECVETDGTVSLWLMMADEDCGAKGCACSGCAPHDQYGQILTPCASACGAPTTVGHPCARRVPVGERCHQHKARQT